MAEYVNTEAEAVERIRQCSTVPVFFAKILHGTGREMWMFDFEHRDYTGAAFNVLEDHSGRIRQIRGENPPAG